MMSACNSQRARIELTVVSCSLFLDDEAVIARIAQPSMSGEIMLAPEYDGKTLTRLLTLHDSQPPAVVPEYADEETLEFGDMTFDGPEIAREEARTEQQSLELSRVGGARVSLGAGSEFGEVADSRRVSMPAAGDDGMEFDNGDDFYQVDEPATAHDDVDLGLDATLGSIPMNTPAKLGGGGLDRSRLDLTGLDETTDSRAPRLVQASELDALPQRGEQEVAQQRRQAKRKR